mmetsp:Transcript_67053/g.106130  ORF Transcript_67053/g.106130 Transcript_67053/m.106130 type:complete len:285 (-) Transcript_67053:112-966(-)
MSFTLTSLREGEISVEVKRAFEEKDRENLVKELEKPLGLRLRLDCVEDAFVVYADDDEKEQLKKALDAYFLMSECTGSSVASKDDAPSSHAPSALPVGFANAADTARSTARVVATKNSDIQSCGFTIKIRNRPVMPCEGRPGRKAAENRLNGFCPPDLVKKAIPENNGSMIKGELYDKTRFEEFRNLVAELGDASPVDDSKHARQVLFNQEFREKREREADAVLLPDSAAAVIAQLNNMRGTSSSASEDDNARYTSQAMEILAVGQRVASNSNKRMRYALGDEE